MKELAPHKLRLIQQIIHCQDESTLQRLSEFLEQESLAEEETQAMEDAREVYGKNLSTMQEELMKKIQRKLDTEDQ